MKQEDDIIFINRNKKPYFRLVVSLPVALFIILRSFESIYNSSHSYRILILQLLAVFALGALAYLINAIIYLIRSRPVLELHATALEDKVSYAKSVSIKWSNINYLEIRKFNGSDHLLIFLKDPFFVLDTKLGMKKKMIENILTRTGTPIAINLMLLDIRPEELVTKIEARIEVDKFLE